MPWWPRHVSYLLPSTVYNVTWGILLQTADMQFNRGGVIKETLVCWYKTKNENKYVKNYKGKITHKNIVNKDKRVIADWQTPEQTPHEYLCHSYLWGFIQLISFSYLFKSIGSETYLNHVHWRAIRDITCLILYIILNENLHSDCLKHQQGFHPMQAPLSRSGM